MRKKSVIVIVVVVFASLFSVYGIFYMLTPYSGFARSVIWGDSDIKDYERFPFRIIHNSPPVFKFSTIRVASPNDNPDNNKTGNSDNENNITLPFCHAHCLIV
jgi:hypothetical protein